MGDPKMFSRHFLSLTGDLKTSFTGDPKMSFTRGAELPLSFNQMIQLQNLITSSCLATSTSHLPFIGFVSHLKFSKGWSHFTLKQVSALRCFMSKLCHFWKTCTFMQKKDKHTFSASLLAAWSVTKRRVGNHSWDKQTIFGKLCTSFSFLEVLLVSQMVRWF